jgi:predicted acylesterase/phospholipase RssA
MLRRTFGDRMIETTPIDFYCVSADLLTAETIVHRRGPLYLAVGASMSLPGLAPPVRYGNRLLVDGGVLDNLPIDVMAARSEGDIIAVDVMRRISSERSPDPTPAIPSILETLTRSTALGSWSLGVRASTYAALTISPTLGDVGTFEWRSLPKIVELGREAAEKALSEQDTAPWTLPMGVQQVTWWTA